MIYERILKEAGMAFDSAVLAAVVRELRPRLAEARINKVHQTDRYTVIMRWRSREDGGRLLLSAHPKEARLQLTELRSENPDKAPLFAMVLRKWLEGARIRDLSVTPGERVVCLNLDSRNELGDPVELKLILEIMGKHSNMILVDGAGDIIDGLRRYGSNLSRWREVLPGRPYLPPPPMEKLPLPTRDPEELAQLVYAKEDQPLARCLQQGVAGLSPLLAEHICLAAGLSPEDSGEQLGAGELENIYEEMRRLAALEDTGDSRQGFSQGFSPTLRRVAGRYTDFAAVAPLCWEEAECESAPTMNQALDLFYGSKEREQSLHAARQDLLKQLAKHINRLQKKIDIQQSDLARCESAERFKTEGDLLAANLWQLEKGAEEAFLPSFDDPEQLIRVELDPSLTPQENVQRSFRRYAKARKAREQIGQQLAANREELAYAGSIRQALLFAESEEELAEPRREMAAAGYLAVKKESRKTTAKAPAHTPPLPPRSFVTAEGFTVLIGRNNRQNDKLSLKQAAADDIWLHAHEIPGSHVIIRTEGREAPESAVLTAAAWAAWFSQGREADRVDVDVLPAGKLRKPAGSRPGYVIYTGQRTVRVQPQDPENT